MNQGNRPSLMQAWIDDDGTSLPPERIQVPFMLTLPVAEIGADSGQQVKIIPNRLPINKESIFYLNALDIPPDSPEQKGKNTLRFVMQSRIKLFYRPVGIVPVGKVTFRKLLVNRSGNGLMIKNDSVNWVVISDAKANNAKINYETTMIAPLESQSVNVRSNNANNWYLTIVDDYGSYISDKI